MDMKSKLFLRGVDSVSLERAIADFREKQREEETNSEREALKKWIEKKSRSLDLSDRKDREKLLASLMRKGFSYSLIREMMDIEDFES